MNKKLQEKIKINIEKIDGYDISYTKENLDVKSTVFKLDIPGMTMNVVLYCTQGTEGEKDYMFQFFTTFIFAPYKNLEVEFYQLINKLSLQLIQGSLSVTDQDEQSFISYKSTAVLSSKSILTDNNLFLFLDSSVAMLRMCNKKLHGNEFTT
tara:strand:+ start:93 stop:548 length:456 start_codon:yes stop_codon:yes gene_type:complete